MVTRTRNRTGFAIALLAVLGLVVGTARAEDAAWVPTQPVQTGAQNRLAALPDGTVWAVIDHNRILRSTDAGLTWTPVNPMPVQADGIPLTGPANGGSSDTEVAPSSASVAMAANGAALSMTRDGGLTWLPLKPPVVTRSGFEWAEQLERTGAGYWYAKGGAEIREGCPYPLHATPFLTSATGTGWRRADIPLRDGRVAEVRFVDARHGAATVIEYQMGPTKRNSDGSCGFTGTATTSGVYVTADGGAHWRRVLGCKPVCYAVSWSSPDRLVVGRTDGKVQISRDAGRSFQTLGSLSPSTAVGFLQALDCVGRRCFASVNGGGVFRHDGSGEWVEELSTQSVPGLAFGDLAAVDRDRAVTGGPTALLTRTVAPTAGRPVAVGAVRSAGALRVDPWTTVDRDGTWRRTVTIG